uniref:Uncharacterized protein n=1 Tax=Brassica campestris TaxID=3711 RepID=A0A3P6A5U6_BRACM|nr:unnamed protein product [Brassica rapa]
MIYTGRAPRCLKELLSRWCCLSGRNLRSACTAVAGGQEMRGGGACLEWSCPLSFVLLKPYSTRCLFSSAAMSAYARLSFVLHNLAKQKGISVRLVRSLIELSELDKAAQISRLAVCEESYHGWDTKVMMCNDIISSMCKAKSYIIRGFLDLGEHDMANHLLCIAKQDHHVRWSHGQSGGGGHICGLLVQARRGRESYGGLQVSYQQERVCIDCEYPFGDFV